MDFHHRKLLILEKIGSTNKTETVEIKKIDPCTDDCKGDDYSYVYVSPPPPPPPPHPPSPTNNSSFILVLVLCVLGIAFIMVSYFSIVRYRLRNSRRRNSLPVNESREDFIDENHGPVVDHPIWYIRTVGLQQSVIDSIAVFKYKRDEGLVEGTDCSVCLSEFQEDESLRLLPKCGHAFHIHCIDTWLSSHKNCPLCRAPIVNDANSGQVNAGESNLDSIISVQENEILGVENQHEMGGDDEVEENQVAGMSVQEESICSFPIEENSSCNQPVRKNAGRVKSDLASYCVELEGEMEPVRRSVSLDISSASMVYYTMANNCSVEGQGSSNTKDEGCSNVHMEQKENQNQEVVLKPGNRNSSIYRLMKSSSLGRSLQKVPLSMKRSFSSAGKSSIPKHSSSQD